MAAAVPPLTEAAFMLQVCQLAEIRGWSWAHFRPARTAQGWRTPVSGPLGKGWPDLVLVRPARVRAGLTQPGRLVFAELKRDGAKLTEDQLNVLTILEGIGIVKRHDSTEVHVWRPSDWDEIEEVLR